MDAACTEHGTAGTVGRAGPGFCSVPVTDRRCVHVQCFQNAVQRKGLAAHHPRARRIRGLSRAVQTALTEALVWCEWKRAAPRDTKCRAKMRSRPRYRHLSCRHSVRARRHLSQLRAPRAHRKVIPAPASVRQKPVTSLIAGHLGAWLRRARGPQAVARALVSPRILNASTLCTSRRDRCLRLSAAAAVSSTRAAFFCVVSSIWPID